MKIMFVSGMGFLTDAYDLFVTGIVIYPGAVTVRRDGARFGEPALRRHRHLPGGPGQGARTSDSLTGGNRPAQLSPGVWMSTPSTDGYFCRHDSRRASCALLALSTR